jgi:hypothetical protein
VNASTFEDVVDGVEGALRRQFGSAAEIERVTQDDSSAVFGFSVDGVGYSLMVNVIS